MLFRCAITVIQWYTQFICKTMFWKTLVRPSLQHFHHRVNMVLWNVKHMIWQAKWRQNYWLFKLLRRYTSIRQPSGMSIKFTRYFNEFAKWKSCIWFHFFSKRVYLNWNQICFVLTMAMSIAIIHSHAFSTTTLSYEQFGWRKLGNLGTIWNYSIYYLAIGTDSRGSGW